MIANGAVEGRTGQWETVIGLEVHAQVISKAKLFSGAAIDFGAEANTQVSPVDAAFPGMLPVINRVCVEQAVRTGLGLDAEIRLASVFDRKNYFYPDLPAGYQISQYQQPVVGRGRVVLDMPDRTAREIGITRLHLEQDAGKSLHDQHPSSTYVDLNRAGVALMEIVSEPDLRSAEEAGIYLRKLRSILRYLGTCDGNMEEGSLRCDVNVSVRRPGEPYGTRCEIKNVNSVRYVMQSIEYETRRQIEIIEEGGTIAQQTRLFDAARGITARCARRRKRTTTATSPIPICCRWSSIPIGWTACAPSFPSSPTRRRRVLCRPMAYRPMTRACWSPRGKTPSSSSESPPGATPRRPPIGSWGICSAR